MAGQQPILFSGSAADMLKSMGKDVPETKEQSSLEASRAVKAAMEEPCHDPHCTREARARGGTEGEGGCTGTRDCLALLTHPPVFGHGAPPGQASAASFTTDSASLVSLTRALWG